MVEAFEDYGHFLKGTKNIAATFVHEVYEELVGSHRKAWHYDQAWRDRMGVPRRDDPEPDPELEKIFERKRKKYQLEVE